MKNMSRYLIATHIIILFTILGCEQKIARYEVEYIEPYYVINIKTNTPVYKDPNITSDIVLTLEEYQIVKMTSTISLEEPSPVWYFIEGSDVKGYALEDNFKVFATEKEAEQYLLKTHPKRGLYPLLTIYTFAEKDFQKSYYSGSLEKLYRFLELKSDLKETHPVIYNSTKMLIGKLYLTNKKDAQKAVLHFEEIIKNPSSDKETELFGAQFSPTEVLFYTNEMENYLNHRAYMHRQAVLTKEAEIYLAKAHELNDNSHLAKDIYLKTLYRAKRQKLESYEIAYFNHSLDRYLAIIDESEKLPFLNSLSQRLRRKQETRYIIYKLALTYSEQKDEIPNRKRRRAPNNKELSKDYFRQFISIFENKQQKDHYPEEISHYMNAKEKLQELDKSKDR